MFHHLILYRQLMDDPILIRYAQLVNLSESNVTDVALFKSTYYELCSMLLNTTKNTIVSIHDYLATQIVKSDQRFSRLAQMQQPLFPALENILHHDIRILQTYFTTDLTAIAEIADDSNCMIGTSEMHNPMLEAFKNAFDDKEPHRVSDALQKAYCKYGSGDFAFDTAFRVADEGHLEGIHRFNPQSFEALVGYPYNRQRLIRNIDAFVKDKPYNHVLLVGDNGTGKSSSVRALIPHFKDANLKLIEIKKHHILHLPLLFEQVLNRSGKFIFFLDDLTFEIEESTYKLLKSIIEGSAESIPSNVCFCVTSNRRHIIKESRVDRETQMHLSDALNENTSLADRFGLYLHYYEPSQSEYLEIVDAYAQTTTIDMAKEALHFYALRFSRQVGGRSGRIAKQYVTHLQAGLIDLDED